MQTRKFYFILLTTLFLAFVNSSCKKPVDGDNGSGGGNGGPGNGEKYGIAYYDHYSTDAHASIPNVEESYRVCFDMNKNELRWKKKNEFPILPSLISSGTSNEFHPSTKPFLHQNSIIKIFASHDLLRSINGIYFQKIDINTGEALVSKRIIEPTDFNIYGFPISTIATDGQNFYFSCGNGFVYCFDGLGNLVWKKGSYSFLRSIPFYRYALLYYDEGRIYFQTVTPTNPNTYTLVCLAANTGDLLWTTPGLDNNLLNHELVFSKNHAVLFENPFSGSTFIIRKSDGQKLIENILPYQSSTFRVIPIGAINDSTVAYFDRTGVSISHIDVTKPGITKTVDLSENIYPFSSIFYKGKVFSIRVTASTQITVHGINPNTGFIWKKSIPITTKYGQFYRLRYFAWNDKLYILCSGRFENNQWWDSMAIANQMPLSLVILDVNSGAILKHYNNLPGGIPLQSSPPDNYITDYQYMYNLLVTE